MKFGDFDLTIQNFGFFRLDGGSMFGSVPKNLWSRRIPSDAENCIKLATRSLILRKNGRVFLIDVGMGEKWNEKSRAIYAIQNVPEKDWCFKADEITDVLLTHLHFDHAGGISRWKEGEGGPVVPCYPKATVHLQASNLTNAKAPTMKERASYLVENYGVLEKLKLNLVDGTTELIPGLFVHKVDGHTKGQQWIEVHGGNDVIFYSTDLVPTSHHLPIPFHMGYDNCAETLLREKETFLEEALKRNAIIFFEHDPDIAAVRIKKDERGHFAVREVLDLTDR